MELDTSPGRLIVVRAVTLVALAALALSFAGCGDDDDDSDDSSVATATETVDNPDSTPPEGTGTLAGSAVAGPPCSPEIVGATCPPVTVADVTIQVRTLDDRTEVASTQTDADGKFSFDLEPGTYVAHALPDAPSQISQPVEVTVSAGATTSVELEINTAIR